MDTLDLTLSLLCLAAFIFIIFQLKNFIPALKSYRWSKADALISAFNIDITKDDQTSFYQGKIKFEFDVNNEKFIGEKICFSNSLTTCCPDSSTMKHLQNAFQNQKPVQIFYDPKAPQNAVIKKGIPSSMLINLFGAIFFLCSALFCFL